MATWKIVNTGKVWRVTYHNLHNHKSQNLGENPNTIDIQTITDWVAATAVPGDVAFLNGVPVFQKFAGESV